MPRRKQGQPLTNKQARFVDEYLKDLNAKRAAMRAGYSAKSADEIGAQLLRKTQVADAIAAALNRRAKRTEVTADKVVREYARIAFANMDSFAEWDGSTVKLRPSVNLNSDDAAAVMEVSSNQFGPKIKLHPKGPALDKLGDHLGLWKRDPAELLELFLASLPPSVAGLIRAGIQQQVSGGGPPGADAGARGGAKGAGGEPIPS